MKKISAKEAFFLKNEHFDLKPPKRYLSDLIIQKAPIINKTRKSIDSKTRKKKFLCALIDISFENNNTKLEDKMLEFESCFHDILDKKKTFSIILDKTLIVLLFWGYENEVQAFHLLSLFKNSLSEKFDAKVRIGASHYPYHNFLKSKIFDNAIKAFDHAGFFGLDALVYFDANSLNISGDRYYELELYEMATKEYKKGIEIEPDNTNLINSLGVCYAINNKLGKAKNEFEKAMKRSKTDLIVIYNLSLVYIFHKDIDTAIKLLKNAHKKSDKFFEIELLLGRLLFKKGRFKNAFLFLENASKLNSGSSIAFKLKGEVFLKQKNAYKAKHEFDSAIKINPYDAVSLSGYARALEMQDKNLKIALSFAKHSLILEPDNELFKQRIERIQKKIDNTSSEKNIKTG